MNNETELLESLNNLSNLINTQKLNSDNYHNTFLKILKLMNCRIINSDIEYDLENKPYLIKLEILLPDSQKS